MNAKLGGLALVGALGAACVGGNDALAAFKIDSYTVDGGGGKSAGTTFIVTGTIGQADAEPLQPSVSSDGRFSATGGFWARPHFTLPLLAPIFYDGFE